MKKYYSPTFESTDLSTIRPMMAFDGTGPGNGQSGEHSAFGVAPKRKVF